MEALFGGDLGDGSRYVSEASTATMSVEKCLAVCCKAAVDQAGASAAAELSDALALGGDAAAAGARPSQGVLENAAGKALIHHLVRRPGEVAAQVEARVHDVATREVMLSSVVPLLCQAALRWERISGGGGVDGEKQQQQQQPPQAQSAALTFLACFLPLPQPQEEGAATAVVEQAPPTYAALLVCVAASPALCAFFEETPEDVRQEAQRIVELSADEGLGVPQASTEAAAAAAAAPSPASDARVEELKDTVTAAVFTSVGQLERVARGGAAVAAAASDVAPPTKLQVAAVQALVAFLSVVHSRGGGGAAGDDLLWRCFGSVQAALRLLRGWSAAFRPLLPAACDALLERLQAMAELRRCRAAAEHNARRVGAGGGADDAAAARAASARDAAALHCVVLLAGSLAEPMQASAARLPRRFTLQPTAVAAAAEAAATSGAEAFEASIEAFLRRRKGKGGAEEEAAVAAAAAAVEHLAGLLQQRVRGARPLFEDVAAAYVAVGALSKPALDGLLAAAGAAGASEPAERARGALTGLCRSAMALLAGRRSSADEALRGDCDRERSLASAALAGVLKRVRKAGGGGGGGATPGGGGGFAPDVAAAELAQLVARCGEPAVAVAVETAVVQYRTRRSANGVVLLIKELLGLCVNPAAVGAGEAKKMKNTLGLGTLYEDSAPVCVDACVSAVWQLLAEVAPSAVLGGLAADGAAAPAEEEATASFVASELFKVADAFAAGDAGKAAKVQLAAVFVRLAFRHTVAPLLSRVVCACADPAAAAAAGSAGQALAEYLRQRKDGSGGGAEDEASSAAGGAELTLQKIQRKLAAKKTGGSGGGASDGGAFFAVETLEKVAAAYAAQRCAASASASAAAAGEKRKQKKTGGKRRSRSSAADPVALCDESVEFPVLLLNAALTHLRAEGHAFSHNEFEGLLEEGGEEPPPSPLLPQRALVTPADLYGLCTHPATAGASTAAATPVLVQLCSHLASVWAAAVPANAWGGVDGCARRATTTEGGEGKQKQLLVRCRYAVGDFRLLLPPSSPGPLRKRKEEEEASGANEEAPPRAGAAVAAAAGVVQTRFELLCGVLFDEPAEELVMSAACAAVGAAAGAVARAALATGGGGAAAADAAAVVCSPLLRRLEETLGKPEQVEEADGWSHSLFDQLAPLLLLRNLPAVYCGAAPVRHALLGVMLRGIGAADAAGLPPLPPQVLAVAADLAPRCVAGCYSFAGAACCGEAAEAGAAVDGCRCAAVTRLADALVARMPATGDAEAGLKKVLLFVCRTAVSVIGSCPGEVAAFAAPATGGGSDAATGSPVELLQGLVLRAVARAGGVGALRTTAVFAAVTDAVSLVCAAEVRSLGIGAVARRRPSLWTLLDGAATEEEEEEGGSFDRSLVTPQALVSTIAYLSKGDLSAVALGGPVAAADAAHARGVPEELFASVLRYALGEVAKVGQHNDARSHLELLFNSIYHWQAASSTACMAQLRTRADDLLNVCVRHLADPYPVNHTALKLVGVVLSAASAEEKAAAFVASVAQALAPLTDPQRNNAEVATLASRLLSFLVA